jgi:hypothetical protein
MGRLVQWSYGEAASSEPFEFVADAGINRESLSNEKEQI